MSTQSPFGVRVLCGWLASLLVVLPACQQRPVNHPDSVKRLLVDYRAPTHYDQMFEPIPEEERLRFEIPEPKPYRLGIGDRVRIRVLSTPIVPGFEAPFETVVKEDGQIPLPLVGRVGARDRTVAQLEEALTKTFRDGYAKNAFVTVEVIEYAARRFYVVGEVGTPSALPVTARTTLLEALIKVGGTNLESADLEEAYIVRNEKPIPFSIEDIVMRGHPAGRLVMEENDVVYIPHVKDRADFVYVFGQVGSPSRVPMEHEGPAGSTGTITLAAALAIAGGIQSTADINDVRVYRGGWQNPKEFRLGVHEVYMYGEDIQLKPGDRIAVGISDQAQFEATIGPTVRLITGATSVLSLALSAAALADRTR